jgi:hypothetical protein
MLNLTRRVFFSVGGLAAVAVAVGCDSEPKPSHTATLLNNEEVHRAFSELDDAVSSLESNASDFDDENWRDVVPEVKTDADNIRDAIDSLRQTLGYSS